jgi:hypothetical protein
MQLVTHASRFLIGPVTCFATDDDVGTRIQAKGLRAVGTDRYLRWAGQDSNPRHEG